MAEQGADPLADASLHATGQRRIERYPEAASEAASGDGDGAQQAGCSHRSRLAALEAEELELRQRLASGTLTAEDEAIARARLAAIAVERSTLVAELLLLAAAAQEGSEGDADDPSADAIQRLGALDAALDELDAEEAELRRRLAAGGLEPADAEACHARLAAIAAARDELLQQRRDILDALLGPAPLVDDEVQAALLAKYATGLDRRDEELDAYALEADDPSARRIWHPDAAAS